MSGFIDIVDSRNPATELWSMIVLGFASPTHRRGWRDAGLGGYAKKHACFADHDRLQRDDEDDAPSLQGNSRLP